MNSRSWTLWIPGTGDIAPSMSTETWRTRGPERLSQPRVSLVGISWWQRTGGGRSLIRPGHGPVTWSGPAGSAHWISWPG